MFEISLSNCYGLDVRRARIFVYIGIADKNNLPFTLP